MMLHPDCEAFRYKLSAEQSSLPHQVHAISLALLHMVQASTTPH